LHLSAFFNFWVIFFVTSQALEREFSGAGSYVSQRLWKNSPKQHKGIVFCVKIRSGVSDASPSAVSFHLFLYRRKPLTFNSSIVNPRVPNLWYTCGAGYGKSNLLDVR